MELKWYENVNAGTGKRFWWTQRDKLGNCFEIYGTTEKKFVLFVNGAANSEYGALTDAQKAATHMWDVCRPQQFRSLEMLDGPWRNDACIGYAQMAMRRAGLDERTIWKALKELNRCFDDVSVEEAGAYYAGGGR